MVQQHLDRLVSPAPILLHSKAALNPDRISNLLKLADWCKIHGLDDAAAGLQEFVHCRKVAAPPIPWFLSGEQVEADSVALHDDNGEEPYFPHIPQVRYRAIAHLGL